MITDLYRYRLHGDIIDLVFIKSKIPAFNHLFNPGYKTWAATGANVEEVIDEICKRNKELSVSLYFENAHRDEKGLILFTNGRKRWIN
jgi:hypothetical protein